MLPSRAGSLAEAIITKILTKNHPDSLHSYPDSPHSHPDSPHPTLIPRIPTPIPHIPTSIPRIPTLITLISRVPIFPLILFPDSPFQLLQIVIKHHYKYQIKEHTFLYLLTYLFLWLNQTSIKNIKWKDTRINLKWIKKPAQSRSLEQHDVSKKAFSDKPVV